MKYFIFLLIFCYSCSNTYAEKPTYLIEEDKMAQLIAELVIEGQVSILDQNNEMKDRTKKVLQQYNVKGQDFTDSYVYYLSNPKKLNSIYEQSQKIIMDKDPKGKKYIEEKIKETQQQNQTEKSEK